MALSVVVAAAMGLTGCASSKSENPLSPTIAGPIPGVTISAPAPVTPATSARIAVEQQPITLTVQNATTSGVRPLNYLFEVASDVEFTTTVYTKSDVAPGTNGQTSLRLPDPLAAERNYYWRARAQDGANTGTYSAAVPFAVFTPIVIQAPTLVSPVGDATTSSLRPTFTIRNAPRSGPVGAIQYRVEVADSDSFANTVAAWTVNEQTTQTTTPIPQDLSYSRQYFWRARAFDPTTTGPVSSTASFRTLAAPVVVVPPSGGGNISSNLNCGAPVAADGLPFGQAAIYNSPFDVASWCVTSRITSVQFTRSAFLVDFDKRDGAGRWPDSPFGDGLGGTIQYTLGMCLNINGLWDCSAVVQFWYGRPLDSSAAPSDVGREWFYDPGRWGPMAGHQPANGETVGLFVCAGNCRNVTVGEFSLVHERSNVVMVQWQN